MEYIGVFTFSFQAMDISTPCIKRYTADALAKIGDQKAAVPLVKNLDDPDPEVRWATAKALRMLDKRNSG